MTVALAVAQALAVFLWCYAGVLLIVWVRHTAAMGPRHHVGMTAALLGGFVPVICGFVLIVVGAAVLGLGLPVRVLAVLLPAGLALSLRIELADIETPGAAVQLRRLLIGALAALALVTAAAV